jgi:hypothetical protein
MAGNRASGAGGRHRHAMLNVSLGNGRQLLALLGLFAVLFQAMLFGWHSHPVPVPVRSHDPAGISLAQPGSPMSPLTADDDCEICAALHHHAAAPLAFAALSPPPLSVVATVLPAAPIRGGGTAQGFHARAPPRA